MPDADFALMKMVHSTWALKLRAFLNGTQKIDANDLIPYQYCDLGNWIYSVGLPRYGHLKDMQELEKVHKSMHDVAKRVVDLKLGGQGADGGKGIARSDLRARGRRPNRCHDAQIHRPAIVVRDSDLHGSNLVI